jgi:predicted ATPase with chaperone activity
VDCRVWGVVEDRLVELLAEPDRAFRVVGLPEDRSRTTADRVRAALLNSGLLREAPLASIRFDPPVATGTTCDLDLPVALATLVWVGLLGRDLRWIFATGRLGLDGAVFARGLAGRVTLGDVVERSCRTRVVGFERMFGRVER